MSVSSKCLIKALSPYVCIIYDKIKRAGNKKIKYFEKYFFHRLIVYQTKMTGISLTEVKVSLVRNTKLEVSRRYEIKLIPN